MNGFQTLWWEQTRSDHSVLLLLRKKDYNPCHQLHYLQMVTEKLGKAYFWRTGQAPPKSHASFLRFVQALDDRSEPSLAGDHGPNPANVPVLHSFDIWKRLTGSGTGRQLLKVIDAAVMKFPEYG